ncbi:MAG: zonular occludens toxin domain-containing protein [Parvibaculaceae bacterium]|nr:zonular occludens toxin domain-containing protein [Parvibaculaceae bacterium]
MSKDASIDCIFGMRGSGKSTKAIELFRKSNMPGIIIDPTRSWGKDLDVEVSGSLQAVVSKMRNNWRKKFRIVYKPPAGHEAAALHHISGLLFRAQSGYFSEKHSRQVMLVAEEANLSYPSRPLPGNMQGFTDAILQGRHYGINIIGISQRPALVHPNLRGNASDTYVFRLADDRSRSAVMEICGTRHRPTLQSLKKYHFMKISDGEVTLGKTRRPSR